jgi:peptidoglycan/xylan/chitin deacetylase (PgdA/CDA1 family)
VRRKVKGLLGQTLFASRLSAVLLRDAAVIVAFHRVQETAAPDDGLTIDVEMFEQFCRYFSRHFKVVSLSRIVQKLEQGERLNGELAITFDDGYRDNFETAAPVLEKLSLPATFFIVTKSIGTDLLPWWDAERGVRHPWMTWQEVRALHRKGFDIGAHTRTHADLGRISGAEAEREILGSRRDLEDSLGAAVDLFAYPYGGPSHLSEDNRERIKNAGFRCCCSCHGGINFSGGSPFRFQRVPISAWYASPHQFGFEVAVDRSLVNA